MIDLTAESLITLKESLNHFPGRKISSLATIYRWFQSGVRGVKLETAVIGKIRYTSKEAIARFCLAQNRPTEQSTTKSITQRQRRTQAKAAQDQLIKALSSNVERNQ